MLPIFPFPSKKIWKCVRSRAYEVVVVALFEDVPEQEETKTYLYKRTSLFWQTQHADFGRVNSFSSLVIMSVLVKASSRSNYYVANASSGSWRKAIFYDRRGILNAVRLSIPYFATFWLRGTTTRRRSPSYLDSAESFILPSPSVCSAVILRRPFPTVVGSWTLSLFHLLTVVPSPCVHSVFVFVMIQRMSEECVI